MRLADLPSPIIKYVIGLWRRRWLILMLGWGLALIGWTALRLVPDVYESRAQLYFNTSTVSSEAAINVATTPDYDRRIAALQLQLLSRENLEKVISDTGLDEDIQSDAELEKAIQHIQDNVKVLSPELSFFNISYVDKDPVIAQKIVNSLVNRFIEQDLASLQLDNASGLANYGALIEEKRAQIEAKNQEIADFQRANADVLASANRNQRVLEQKEQNLSSLQFELASARQQRTTLTNQLGTTPRYSSGTELDTLKLELAQLRSVYKENHPDIQRLVARINELENSGSALPDNPAYERLKLSLQTTEGNIRALQNRIAQLRSEIAKLSLEVTLVPEVQAQMENILLGKDQLEKEYQALLGQRNKLTNSSRLGELGGAVKYEIYESPKVASLPASPPRALLTLGIMILGLGVAAGLAFLMAQLDNTYTQAEELEDAFGLPVLGQISPSETKATRSRLLAERFGLLASLGLLVMLTGVMFLVLQHSPVAKKLGPVADVLEKIIVPPPPDGLKAEVAL